MSENNDGSDGPYTNIPWTESGYPVVDGKYINLETGTLETTTPDMWFKAGPPDITLYMHNRMSKQSEDQFQGWSTSVSIPITEWLGHFGDFVKLCGDDFEVWSLNVTTFEVYVVYASKMSKTVFMERMSKAGIWPADRKPPKK